MQYNKQTVCTVKQAQTVCTVQQINCMYNKTNKRYVMYNKHKLYVKYTNKLFVMYNKHKLYIQHNKQTVCNVQ